MKGISKENIQELKKKYILLGGTIKVINDTTIMYGENLKTNVIDNTALTIKTYKYIPKKYVTLL